MESPVFNKKHLRDYLVFGLISGTTYAIAVWIYLSIADYRNGYVIYSGCILFMFIIMLYSIKLTKRQSDYKSTVTMMMAGHLAVLAGIVVSVLLSLTLCFIYIPGFFTGNSQSQFLKHDPSALNIHNVGTVFDVFFPATLGNFGAGAFMAILIPYVLKKNQTKDKALSIEPEK